MINGRDYYPFIEKWVFKLDIEEAIFFKFDKDSPTSNVIWDSRNNGFLITLNDSKYTGRRQAIIHELGHIYFAKEYNNMDIAKNLRPKDTNSIEYMIKHRINEAFTNYHISKFDYYYSLYSKPILEAIKHKIDKTLKYMLNIPNYVYSYLELNHVLSPKDRINNYPNIKAWFKDFRDNIVKNNPQFTYKMFQGLDTILNGFRKIRDQKNSEVYFAFRDKILHFLRPYMCNRVVLPSHSIHF